MYGPPHASMNEQHHEPEDVECSDGDDATDNPPTQIRYDGPNSAATVLDAVGSHALFAPDMASHLPPPSEDGGADQLSLSFQGQVYVFDSVSPEKVQAVLLLLGGYEVPTGIPSPGMTTPQNQRTMADYPGRSSQPQRTASLNRFREKRKERCFEKKIRYTVRKEVALRMQRKKGQFTSSKSVVDDQGSSSADGNGSSGQEEQETSCRHCGISSKSTPMMRRGPDGPRTLCNACGLKWANKGILRDLSKVPIVTPQAPSILTQDLSRVPLMMQNHPMKVNGEANVEGIVIPATNILSK